MWKLQIPTIDPSDQLLAKAINLAQSLKADHVAAFSADRSASIRTTDHYKAFGDLVMKNQHKKCAYCESPIENQPGDVEHYRPKGRIRDEAGRLVEIVISDGHMAQHPGYFWLAYHLDNLFMSCIDCNRRRMHKGDPASSSGGIGKADFFPISGIRATDPDDILDAEDALLLHPIYDDPFQHLSFEASTGFLRPRTARGEATIAILGLNRENLLVNRKRAFKHATGLPAEIMSAYHHGNKEMEQDLVAELREISAGKRPYTAVQFLAMSQISARFKGIIDAILAS